MSQRTKLILVLLVLFAVLAAAVVVWRTMGRPTVTPVVIDEPELEDIQPKSAQEEEGVLPATGIVLDEEAKEELNLAQKASDFAMKFGSYSRESNLDNIRELIPQMTVDMQAQAQEFMIKEQETMPAQFGVTTKVLSKKVLEFEEGSMALVLLSTQRQETSVGKRDIYYQDIEVELANQDGEWKVARAEWMSR